MLNMHNEMYASLMDVYLPGAALQAQLISDTKAKASAQKKTTWCQQWMDSKASFGLRLVAFAAVQSVMHAGTCSAQPVLPIFTAILGSLRCANTEMASGQEH